jgi:bla regulator protein BlaR1
VVDRIGRAYVQDTLNRLSYGNCDISLWEGGGNLYFPEIMEMPSVNGFWQESSLKISPVNQVNVLYQIFHNQNGFTAGNIELLKDVMLQDSV